MIKPKSDSLLLAVDLAGTFLFAIEGAVSAVRGDLDFLGLMVLAFATALGGGILRDLLIGAVPPNSIRDWRYGAVAFTGGAVVFFLYGFVQEIPYPLILVLDAAGLSLFAVAGVRKALEFGIHPFMAPLMGMLTGVGGGTIRDILLASVPKVLRAEIYAVAALAGSIVLVLCIRMKISANRAALIGGIACFALRLVSVWQGWNLPKLAGS